MSFRRFIAAGAFALTLVPTLAPAQDFPAGAAVPSAKELETLLSGRTFDVKLPNGTSWRMQFDGLGAFFVDVSTGQRDGGGWKTQDGKLCTTPQRGNASCNEMRTTADGLFLKRDNGQIIQLVPRQ